MKRRDPILINLGSGPNGIDGWVNYDWGVLPLLGKFPLLRNLMIKIKLLPSNYAISWPKIRLHDLRKRLPMNDNSVDFIYCSHVMEHFEKYETEALLRECKRVLKKNGKVRIVLPDLKKMVVSYKGADNFCREFFGFDKDKKYGLMAYFIRGHQWMYDKKSLQSILKKNGFSKVVECKFRRGECPDIERLDYEGHKKISMYLEAQ